MSQCELSPQAHAISTVLTAFIGSIVNGLANGAFIAFITGWIAWLAVIRVLLAAGLEYWQTFKAGTEMKETEYGSVAPSKFENIEAAAGTNVMTRWNHGVQQDVKLTGWLGWVWSAIYTPASQTIWLAVNVRSSGGGIAIARAIAVGVSALSLTYDNKQRYGAALGRKWGSWAFVTFNFWNATACLVLGVECAVLLIDGAIQLQPPIPFYIIYPIFACVWAAVSFKLLPVIDGSRKVSNIFVNLLVGAFAGLFVAAPAFVMWQNAEFAAKSAQMMGSQAPSGLSLGSYISCQGASFWQKFAAIMP